MPDIVILKPSPSSPIRFCYRYLHILEADPAGHAGAHAQLAVQVAARYAGRGQIDDEGERPSEARVALGLVFAVTSAKSALEAREIHIFSPFSTY